MSSFERSWQKCCCRSSKYGTRCSRNRDSDVFIFCDDHHHAEDVTLPYNIVCFFFNVGTSDDDPRKQKTKSTTDHSAANETSCVESTSPCRCDETVVMPLGGDRSQCSSQDPVTRGYEQATHGHEYFYAGRRSVAGSRVERIELDTVDVPYLLVLQFERGPVRALTTF